jgi:2-polyprenyl-3-methyl-5-hydroxy-6-metoxy-1,4-benzoquinol methylase
MKQIATIDISVCNKCGSTQFVNVAVTKDFEFLTCSNEFTMVVCDHCGLTWLKNRPHLSELKTIYPEHYSTYNYDTYLGPFIKNIRDQVQRLKLGVLSKFTPPDAVIADVGCGNASLLRVIKKFGPNSWQLVGVDIASEAMEILKANGIAGVQGRFEDVEWTAPRPHVVIMNQILEHLEDPQAAVARAYELLNPGGVLIIETPSTDGWDAMLFRRRYWGGWHTPRHWHLFNEQTLRDTLTKHGFKIARVDYLLNPYAWLHSVRFTLREKFGWHRVGELFQVNFLPALVLAVLIDTMQKLVRRKTSNIRIVGQK